MKNTAPIPRIRRLGKQYLMAFRAEIGLPVVLDIDGMDESHDLIDGCVLHVVCRTLCDDSMAHVAVL